MWKKEKDFLRSHKIPAWLPLLGRWRCTLLLAILAQADGNSWDAAKTGAGTDLKNNRFYGDGWMDGLHSRCWIQKASENQGTWNDQMFEQMIHQEIFWSWHRGTLKTSLASSLGTFSPKRQECRAPKCLTPRCRIQCISNFSSRKISKECSRKQKAPRFELQFL